MREITSIGDPTNGFPPCCQTTLAQIFPTRKEFYDSLRSQSVPIIHTRKAFYSSGRRRIEREREREVEAAAADNERMLL